MQEQEHVVLCYLDLGGANAPGLPAQESRLTETSLRQRAGICGAESRVTAVYGTC